MIHPKVRACATCPAYRSFRDFEANNTSIGPVSDKLEINEGDAELSKDAEHAKTKSPSVFDHDPSEVTHCSMD